MVHIVLLAELLFEQQWFELQLFVCTEHRKILDKKQNQFVVNNQIGLMSTQLHLEVLHLRNQTCYIILQRILASNRCLNKKIKRFNKADIY
jgi:hypothetical protein